MVIAPHGVAVRKSIFRPSFVPRDLSDTRRSRSGPAFFFA